MKIVFFDLETGGLDWTKHPIIQIAAIAVDADLAPIESFQCKVKFPVADADAQALSINHYDLDVWDKEGVAAFGAVQMFARFLLRHASITRASKAGNPYSIAQLAGHNAASFDIHFLTAFFKRNNAFLPASYRVLDTLQRAAWHFHENGGEPEDLKLQTLAKHFGVEPAKAHDALDDVRVTIEVYKKLKEFS